MMPMTQHEWEALRDEQRKFIDCEHETADIWHDDNLGLWVTQCIKCKAYFIPDQETEAIH